VGNRKGNGKDGGREIKTRWMNENGTIGQKKDIKECKGREMQVAKDTTQLAKDIVRFAKDMLGK
jgi:hypothetical protein